MPACQRIQSWRLQEALLKDPHVGDILSGFVKTLVFVSSAIRLVLVSQPITTIHDLETAILTHPMFENKNRFEDACIGKLQFHPLVRHHFGLNDLPTIPASFPAVSGLELVHKLFSADVVKSFSRVGSRLSNKRANSVYGALNQLAEAYRFDDFRKMGRCLSIASIPLALCARPLIAGIAVQDGSFLGQLIPAMTNSGANLAAKARTGRHVIQN